MNVRRAVKAILLIAGLAGVSAPREARAEGYINPWAGIVFGTNSDTVFSGFSESVKSGISAFGVNFGDTGNIMGIDVNFGFTPDLTKDDINDLRVIDLMGGISLGPQIGRGTRTIRPVAVGGVGLLRTQLGDGASNDFGFNVGGGVLGYFSEKVGLRVEARYYRTLNGSDLGDFHFTRLQFGLMIR